MGINQPKYDFNVFDKAPCQFIGTNGCVLPRIKRSYRCTWYFCDSLLTRFEAEFHSQFEMFEQGMTLLSCTRQRLINKFRTIWFE
jgi:hypothetical protein